MKRAPKASKALRIMTDCPKVEAGLPPEVALVEASLEVARLKADPTTSPAKLSNAQERKRYHLKRLHRRRGEGVTLDLPPSLVLSLVKAGNEARPHLLEALADWVSWTADHPTLPLAEQHAAAHAFTRLGLARCLTAKAMADGAPTGLLKAASDATANAERSLAAIAASAPLRRMELDLRPRPWVPSPDDLTPSSGTDDTQGDLQSEHTPREDVTPDELPPPDSQGERTRCDSPDDPFVVAEHQRHLAQLEQVQGANAPSSKLWDGAAWQEPGTPPQHSALDGPPPDAQRRIDELQARLGVASAPLNIPVVQ